MRDAVAGLVAVILLLVAASLATTLTWYRRRRKSAREAESAQGRQIIAELPTADDLVFVSQDSTYLYYGAQAIPKESIVTVRVLINGAPIAAYVSRRHAAEALSAPTSFEDRPEGIARDRWDVAIEAQAGTTLIACGAIRERVSQELARAVFDAVKRDLEERDHHSISGSFAR
nr:hypothetical protein Hi04_10k_c446_00024 [uncultured bacterium]